MKFLKRFFLYTSFSIFVPNIVAEPNLFWNIAWKKMSENEKNSPYKHLGNQKPSSKFAENKHTFLLGTAKRFKKGFSIQYSIQIFLRTLYMNVLRFWEEFWSLPLDRYSIVRDTSLPESKKENRILPIILIPDFPLYFEVECVMDGYDKETSQGTPNLRSSIAFKILIYLPIQCPPRCNAIKAIVFIRCGTFWTQKSQLSNFPP